MKILYGSDTHNEFKKQQELPELPEYDIAILAGDIGVGIEGHKWATSFFPSDKPVLYIPGNHEYYGQDFLRVNEALSLVSEHSHVKVLNNDTFEFNDCTFVGATLWTDFILDNYPRYSDLAYAKAIGDFQVIKYGDRLYDPNDSRKEHNKSRYYLTNSLVNKGDKKTVVVTHFLPTQEVITPFWQGNNLNPYFCNDLDSIIALKPDMWIYGHTHDKGDKLHSNGHTRLLCNPRGYPKEKKDYFKWKVVEL